MLYGVLLDDQRVERWSEISTILEYPCGCQYYSDSKQTRPIHLCDNHKIQAFSDALKDTVKEMEKATETQWVFYTGVANVEQALKVK